LSGQSVNLLSIFSVITACSPPIGSLPPTWTNYSDAIDLINQTFACFDGSRIIDLSQINDDYLDCDDGSDEPGTGVSSIPQFYCQNTGTLPILIRRWSVGDGICDCCDGSDELSNPHSQCPNTCGEREAERQSLLAVLMPIFVDGVAKQLEMSAAGNQILQDAVANKTSIEEQIRQIREEKAKAAPEPTDSPHQDEAQPVEDGPTTQTETGPQAQSESDAGNGTRSDTNPESDSHMESEHKTKSEEKTVEEEPELEVEIGAPDYAFDDVDAPWLTGSAYYGDAEAEDYEYRSSQQRRYDNDDTPCDPEAGTSLGPTEPSADPTPSPKDDWSPHYRHALSSEEADDDSGLPETVIPDLEPRFTPLPQWQEVFVWAWKFTFRCCRRPEWMVDPPRPPPTPSPEPTAWPSYDSGSSEPYDDRIWNLKEQIRGWDEVLRFAHLSPSLVALVGKEFDFEDYKFKFMIDTKKGWETLGTYRALKNRTIFMTEIQKRTRIEMVCANESRLAHMAQTAENRYLGVFATPAVCTWADIEALNATQPEVLKEMVWQRGIDLGSEGS
jgi:hypothetical protein